MSLVRIREEHAGDVAIAAVEGEIDAADAAEVAARLRAPLTNRTAALLVDLSATTYLDSAGINVLFALRDELRRRRQVLHLVVVPESPIARMVSISGLDAVVPVHPSRQGALAQAAPDAA